MNLRRVKHTLLRLSAEEKVIGIGSIAILIGTFLPWYEVVMAFDKARVTEYGLSGDLGVIGFVVFLMSLLSLVMLIAENMHLPLPSFGYKREQAMFFFLGQSTFLTLLTMAIYTKRGLEFTEAGLRFGIWTVLIGAIFGALSAFALIQKTRKQEVVEFFDHDQADEIVQSETVDEMVQDVHQSTEAMDSMVEEAVSFGEDAHYIEEVTADVSEQATDYIQEDEMIEDVQELEAEPKQGGLDSNFYNDN